MPSQAVKNQAHTLIQSNRLDEAMTLLKDAITHSPRDPDLWFLSGLVHGMRADFSAASTAFQRTVDLAPGAFAAWENLGRAEMKLGNPGKARRCYEKSIHLNPASISAHAALGELLRITGDITASRKTLAQALNMEPNSPQLLNQMGATLDVAGDIHEAIIQYRTALRMAPNFQDARLNLARALRTTGNLEESLELYRTCTAAQPQASPAWYGLADVLLELNRWQEALAIFQNLASQDPAPHIAHLRIAGIMMAQGDLPEARRSLEMASQGTPPDHPDVCALRAELEILDGSPEKARTILAPALLHHPEHIGVTLAEAKLAERDQDPSAAIARIESVRSRRKAIPDTLLFSLGKLYEKAGRYDEAFSAYKGAHALRGMKSDLQAHLDEMDSIERFFTRNRLQDLPRSGSTSKNPVFIVGMPRSGTSLAEQILASHPDVHGAGEITKLWQLVRDTERESGQVYPASLSDLGAARLNELANNYLSHTRALAGDASRICDKLPHNFLHLGFIRLLFPGATIIHCKRNPLDTCLSIFTLRFNINHRYAQDLHDLGRYYRRYEQLMDHWRDTLDTNIHTLDYEQLILDQERETRKLLDAAGLEWDSACLRFFESGRTVVTPSHEQVRRPLYASSVERWKRFEKHLEPLKDALHG